MSHPFEEAQKRSDQRLRRRILRMLELGLRVSANGRCAGRQIADQLGTSLESDDHLLGLLRSLKVKQLVREYDVRKLKRDAFGLDFLEYEISEKGLFLLSGQVPVDPDVDDERLPQREED